MSEQQSTLQLPSGIRGLGARKPETKFDRYTFTILKDMWLLDHSEARKLNYHVTYLTTVSDFLNYVEAEQYPGSWYDSFILRGTRYKVSYLFTSASFLEGLEKDAPNTRLAFQLRINLDNMFFFCLVRPWEQHWTEEFLLKRGAMKFLPPNSADSCD